jgi:hypothetical protein
MNNDQFGNRRSSGRKLSDFLRSRNDRGVGSSSGVSGVLSRLFQQICFDLNVLPYRWRYLLTRYVDAEVKNFDNCRDRSSVRNNLNKEFLRPRMSWKVFCKAMMFLDFVGFEIQIHAKHRNGQVTIHRTVVDYTTADEPNFEIIDPDDPDNQSDAFIKTRPANVEDLTKVKSPQADLFLHQAPSATTQSSQNDARTPQ